MRARHSWPDLGRLLASCALAFPLLAASVAAQSAAGPDTTTARTVPPQRLTADDYARAERLLPATAAPLLTGTVDAPTWLPDGRLWYQTRTPAGLAFVLVDPVRRTRIPLLDVDRLAAALGTSRTAVLALRPRLEVRPDPRTATLVATLTTADGVRRACDLAAYACRSMPPLPPGARLSPDGRWAAFRRDHDLWAREVATGRDVRLTTDGSADFGYGTDNSGHRRSGAAVVSWAPDSRRLATFQQDERGVGLMSLIRTQVGRPRLEQWPYPLPGDSVGFRIERVVLPVDTGAVPRPVRFRMPPDFGRTTNARMAETDGSVSDLAWFADGSHVAFVSMARDHHHLWLRVADARTGAVRTVIEEPIPTTVSWRYDFPQWQVLPASQEVVWWSQRDDWGQLYLYDLATGRLKHRITRGVGNVHRIVRIDERTRTLWYEGSGQEPGRDPYFRHLYRVGLDGRGARLLTPEDAHHDIAMSPDGRYLVDTYSTPDRPPVTVLRDADGRVVMPLERGDVSRLVASGWRAPVPFTVTARDGVTELYGLMYLPSRLETTATYPIVDVVYPGPQTGGIGSRAFLPTRGDQQALAELGFVVVQIDALGTPGRSKRFQDATLGRLHDNGLPDQVAGIRQLARRHRFLDSTRVGIWGGSGGGYAAAAALFRYPEFFTVGVAIAGNHDQRSYMDGWGERWQGPFVRTDSSDSYAAAANAAYAANLRGKLLLAYGGMDDNVHPANTLLVVDALIRAGRDFDLLVLPNAGHDPGAYAPYVIRRRWDYFVRHLLGAEPPREYPLGGRPAALP